MIFVIIKHDWDTMESMGNEEYQTIVGYAESQEEADTFVESELSRVKKPYKVFNTRYPHYVVQPLNKVEVK